MLLNPMMLDYAGRARARSLPSICWRCVTTAIFIVIFTVVVTLRAAALALGFACVCVGTFLLVLGGKRSAEVQIAKWRVRFSGLLRLWISDMMRPLRRARLKPAFAELAR